MVGFLGRWLAKKVAFYLIIGVMFLLFSPMYAVIFRPDRDLLYHGCAARWLRAVEPGQTELLEPNTYAQVTGRAVPGSVAVQWDGLLLREPTGALLLLEGYPRTLVHVDRGPLDEELLAGFDLEGVRRGHEPAAPEGWLSTPTTLHGRIYPQQAVLEGDFGTYVGADDLDLHAYRMDHLEGSPFDASWRLLVVDEHPELHGLCDTHLPVLCLGSGMGIAGLLVGRLLWRGRSPASEEPSLRP
jgi:hypothetical protein